MKQSIRLTRATLYFKFIAFRDLTSVRAGATPQRMFEKRKRHGETDVKGPLKYLLMPLLGKNQLAITLHMYASIGPNLDNIHRGQI